MSRLRRNKLGIAWTYKRCPSLVSERRRIRIAGSLVFQRVGWILASETSNKTTARKFIRAKTPRRKVKDIFNSPNLASLRSFDCAQDMLCANNLSSDFVI